MATVRSNRLRRSIRTTMGRLGIAVQAKAKHLGVHFAPGGKTRDLASNSSRWGEIVARRVRAIRLGRRLGVHVFKSGLQPFALYGSSVAMPKLGVIKSMRRSTAKAIGPVSGRSITARLAVARCDPAFEAIKRAVWAWITEVWQSPAMRFRMARAWMQAQVTVATSRRPFVSAVGAAGSCLAAA